MASQPPPRHGGLGAVQMPRQRSRKNPYAPFWAGCKQSKYKRMPHHAKRIAEKLLNGQQTFSNGEVEPVVIENNWLRWKQGEFDIALAEMDRHIKAAREAEADLQACRDELRKAWNKAYRLEDDVAAYRRYIGHLEEVRSKT